MPITEVTNQPTVVEATNDISVAEITETSVVVEVPSPAPVVEFPGGGLLVAGEGLDGGGILQGIVNISLDDDSQASLALADSAVQPGDNITSLVNNADFISAAAVVDAINALGTVYQPLSSNLTAIAASALTAFGLGWMELADVAAARTVLDVYTTGQVYTQAEVDATVSALSGVYQPLDSDLTAIAALTTYPFGRGFLVTANVADVAVKLAAMAPTWTGVHVFNNRVTVTTTRHGNGWAGLQTQGADVGGGSYYIDFIARTAPAGTREVGVYSQIGGWEYRWDNGSLAVGTVPWTRVSGGPTGANPSASVGLSAVNGSATTFMRSDAAPALSQAIVPTWSGFHTFAAQAAISHATNPYLQFTGFGGSSYLEWNNNTFRMWAGAGYGVALLANNGHPVLAGDDSAIVYGNSADSPSHMFYGDISASAAYAGVTGAFTTGLIVGAGEGSRDSGFQVYAVGAGAAAMRIGYSGTDVNYFDGSTQYFRYTNASYRAALILSSSGHTYSNSTDSPKHDFYISGGGFTAGGFSVAGPSNAYISIFRPTQSSGQVGIGFNGGSGGHNWALYLPSSSNTLTWYNTDGGGSNVMTLSSTGTLTINGNLVYGTSAVLSGAPNSLGSVAVGGYANGGYYGYQITDGWERPSFISNGSSIAGIYFLNSSRWLIYGTGSDAFSACSNFTVAPTAGGAYVAVQRATQASGQVGVRLTGGTSGTSWYMYQPTSSNNLVWHGNSADRMSISPSGNVTINTPSSGTTTLTVGAVSSGTSIAVSGPTGNNITIANTGNSINGWWGATTSGMYIGSATNHSFDLLTNNALRVAISNAGNVTINAPSSGIGLTVNGTMLAATVANSTSTTLVAGQSHYITGNATLPNFSAIGQWITLINNSGSAITITKGTTTMYNTHTESSVDSVTLTPRGRMIAECGASGVTYVSGDIS